MAEPWRLAGGNLCVTLEAIAAERGWFANPAYLVGDETYTHADVYAGARASAAVLSAHGVRPGDRVLIVLSDGMHLVWSFLGTLYLGAVAVLANQRLPSHELVAAAEASDPILVVCERPLLETFESGPVLEPARIVHERGSAPAVPAHVCSQSQLAYALFTSGTTGKPRLCFHTHADPLVYDHAFGKAALGLRPGDVTLSVSKTHFAYGLGNSVFFPLLSGATAVLESEAPTADAVLASVSRFGVGVLFAVPSFYAHLLAHPSAEVIASVAIAVCAGEVLPRSLEERIDAFDGPVLLNGIGSTEIGQTFASNVPSSRRFGTVGKALPPYRIRVVDEAGDDLPQGCEGRLLVQGTTLALPCASVHEFRAVTPGLWYPLGDIAVLDGDGYVQVTGRLDDIEIVGGINVHPAELEELLFRHPMVRDVAACATTDSRGVSRLVAYVVPADDAVDRSTLEADLLAGARGRVAPYKVPRSVVFVPELPRTFTGKLRRRALREAATRYEKTNSWQVCQHGTV